MRTAYVRIFTIAQRFAAVFVHYNHKTGKFESLDRIPYLHLWYYYVTINLVLLWATGIFSMIAYAKGGPGTEHLTILHFVLDLLITAEFTECLGVLYTLRNRGSATVQMLNYLLETDKPQTEKDKRDIHTILIYSILVLSIFCAVFTGLIPLVVKHTCIRRVLAVFLFFTDISLDTYYFRFLACAYCLSVTLFLIPPCTMALGGNYLGCAKSTLIMKPSYVEPKNEEGREIPLTFKQGYTHYKQTYLGYQSFSDFNWALMPIQLFFGYTFNVALTFVAIKFATELPVYIWLQILYVNVSVAFAISFWETCALVITTDFEKFVQKWKWVVFSKKTRRMLRACIPTKVHVGAFFVLQSSTVLSMENEIVNAIVTLLVASK